MTRKELLYKLGLLCARNKWITVLVMLAVTAFFTVFAARLEINLGILNLLDRNDPETIKVDYANENFGGMDYTFLSVTADTLPDAKRFADELASLLSESDMVLRVVHKVDVDELMRYGFLFLTPDQIEDFIDYAQESRNDLTALFADVHAVPFLASFNRMLENQILEKQEISDPKAALDQLVAFDGFFDTLRLYLQKGELLGSFKLKSALADLFIPEASDSGNVIKDEYFLSKDERKVMLLVMPSEPGDDLVFTARMMDFMETAIAEMKTRYGGGEAIIGGNIAITRDEYVALQKDTRLTTGVTFVLVLLIFFFFFRKFSDLLLIAVSLVSGIIWTFAITYFYIGFLSITTAFFSAILLGLGVDFAIHIIARYGERLKQGDPVDQAAANALAGAGPGIITGALTTAAAFFVLMICRFKGISQLGFVAGTGIISMVVIMFTLLPAMLVIRDGRKKDPSTAKALAEITTLSRLAIFMVRHRRPAIVLIALLTVVMIYAASKITFNYDFRSLEPRGGQAVEANKMLEKDFGKSIDYGLLFTDTVEQTRQFVDVLKTADSIAEINAISDYLPEDQQIKIPRIKTIAPLLEPMYVQRAPGPQFRMNRQGLTELAGAVRESRRMVLAIKQLAIVGGQFKVEDQCSDVMANADRLAADIDAGVDDYLDGGSYFQRVLGTEMSTLLGNLKQAAKGKPLGIDQLPGVVRDNFIGKDGRFLIYAYPAQYLWNQPNLEKQRNTLRAVTDESTSVGMVFLELIAKIKEDFRFAVWLSLGAVLVLVTIDFRRPITAVMALVPLVLGAVWMVGTMVLLGLSFNLVNVAVVPLIIGIGIDNGVHIIHRYRSETTDKIRLSVQHTGRAIFLSSITTMAGFGSLGLASYVAVASLGWVLLIGVFYCLFTSIVVLPIILSLIEKKVGRI